MELFKLFFIALTAMPRDLKMSYDYMETMVRVKYWHMMDYKVHQLFDQVAKGSRGKNAFRVGEDTWTFRMVQDYSLKVASYFNTAGLQRGDVVAQVGLSGGQAVGLWLGLSRLGVASALIPPRLAPAKTIQLANSVYSKAIVGSPELVKDLKEETLPDYMDLISAGDIKEKNIKDLNKELLEPLERPPKVKASVNTKLLYLFSPDNFLPMPVTHHRYMFIVTSLRKTLDLNNKDILYSPMLQSDPEGSIVAAGQAVIFGTPVVSGGNFDAATFFPYCQHYDATVAIYNDETVQQLLALPPSAADTAHSVRLLMGKGLRDPQLWAQFQQRFQVKRIGQYHGTVDSEGYIMVNSQNKEGAIGYFPWFAFPLYQITLVSLNQETGDEIRNSKGLCESPKRGQPGILVEKLPKDFVSAHFAKRKNIIKDVFKKGDLYINTGEILMRDDHGFYYLMGDVGNIKRNKNQG